MFTEEGRLILIVVLILAGWFAFGYFLGWSRDKLSNKIFDKMLYYSDKVKYWQGQYEESIKWHIELLEEHKKLKEYAIDQIGAEHVPVEFGGELEEEVKQ